MSTDICCRLRAGRHERVSGLGRGVVVEGRGATVSIGTKFCFALVALAAAVLAGWQLGTIFPPEEFRYAGWILFGVIALGSVGVAIL